MTLGTGGCYRVSRTRAHIGADCNEVMLQIQLANRYRFTQLGQETLVRRGPKRLNGWLELSRIRPAFAHPS